ncbi:MAG: glycosyltransferase family 2 protein [Pseudomonadota bacterium]
MTKSQNQEDVPRVVVAIVNYCTAELTINCLRSISEYIDEYKDTHVVVADNASPDGSGKAIADAIEAEGWSHWASVLPLPKNGGFAYGNNEVIRQWLGSKNSPEYFWLLNSDTLVYSGALAHLVRFLDNTPTAGFAGSCLEHRDGSVQHSAFRFHNVFSEFENGVQLGLVTRLLRSKTVAPDRSHETQTCEWLSGASVLIRASVLNEIGLMDEDYFLYFEETDLARRAQARGWESWYVVESRVIHLVGQSSGVTANERALARRPSYWFESRRKYFVKNHGRLYAAVADLALITGVTIRKLRTIITRSPPSHPKSFIVDLVKHSALLNPAS